MSKMPPMDERMTPEEIYVIDAARAVIRASLSRKRKRWTNADRWLRDAVAALQESEK